MIKSKLQQMTDRELVAYWNIIQAGARMFQVGNQCQNHHSIVSEILTERKIPHQMGKRTEYVVKEFKQ